MEDNIYISGMNMILILSKIQIEIYKGLKEYRKQNQELVERREVGEQRGILNSSEKCSKIECTGIQEQGNGREGEKEEE